MLGGVEGSEELCCCCFNAVLDTLGGCVVVIGVVSMLNKHINYNESQLKINNTPPQTTEKSSHHRPPQTPKTHHKPPQATTDHQPQHTHLLCHHPHRAQLNGVFEGLQPLQLLPLRRAHHQHPVTLAFCGGGGVDVCVCTKSSK